MSTAHRLTVLGAALAALGLFAGCGGGSDSGGPAPTASGAGTPDSFGQEAGGADRAAATKAVQSFARAWLGDDAAKACSLMADSTKRNLAVFSSQPGSRDCPGQARRVRAAMTTEMLSRLRGAQVTAVRVAGGRGFVIYRADGASWALPVTREGSAWRVGAIAGYRVG